MGGIEQRRVAGAFADPADMQAQILGVAVDMEGPAEGRRRLLRAAVTARVEGEDAKILAQFLEQRQIAAGRESVGMSPEQDGAVGTAAPQPIEPKRDAVARRDSEH